MTGPDQAAGIELARSRVATAMADAGYRPIDPPIFAAADTFLDRLGERFRRQTCFFEDGMGQELCLRPEITIPVCRMVLDEGYDGAAPLRLRYAGPVFRLGEEGAGALVQGAQAGAEYLGHPDATQADAEILVLALKALNQAGVGPVNVALGDAGAFADLLNGLTLSDRQRAHLKKLFDAHGSALADHLPPEASGEAPRPLDLDLARAQAETELDAQGWTLTGGRTIEDVARRLADRAGRAQAQVVPAEARAAIARFFGLTVALADAGTTLDRFFADVGVRSEAGPRMAALAAALRKGGINLEPLRFDAKVHAPHGYYTGLEFRIDRADGRTVAGGGRYDALIGELAGRPDWRVPAVGCALFLDTIAARRP